MEFLSCYQTKHDLLMTKTQNKKSKSSHSLFSIPLFERLTDLNPEVLEEIPSFKYYSKEDAKVSIENHLLIILQTRTGAKREDYEESLFDKSWKPLPPNLFGVPDYMEYDPTNKDNWQKIQLSYKKAIECYEPRLKNVTVKVIEFDQKQQRLKLDIQGTMWADDFEEEVTFPILL